jgi:hypothetical protein
MVKALTTKNVVTVLAALALTLGLSFAAFAPAKADTVSDLQAQVQALLAQIQAMQGSTTTTTTTTSSTAGCYTFTQNLKLGASGGQVMWVQQFLNNHGFTVAATGAGSPGNETSYFGPATKAAVIAFQNAYASNILTPVGLTSGNGNWFAGTRAQANTICTSTTTTGTTTGTGTGTGTTTTGGGVTVTAGSQPANSLAPVNATRVPFTTFTLTNNSGAAVTVNGITVQRTGLANDNAFAGVILIDSTGLQYGNSQTFNSNHQATIGGTFTLQAGQSMTYTIAGNMETSPNSNAGEVASIALVGVNTSVPVTGSLPITGAQQTINESLTIGKATIALSGFDPNSSRSEAIGTTGLTFSALRITAGSAEDQKLYSITWNQTGSAGSTDISNLMTVVNGTSYPVTVDASGKYYTSTFPGGITITKGNSADVYIQGDLTGSSASGRTVEFDIYRPSDIYLVGQTYGYGITPTTSTSGGSYSVGNNTQSGFQSAANPFYFGSTMKVTGGTLSTVSSASTVAPANIAINVPNQVLGGFQTNFSGEPVTIQSLTIHVASSSQTVATSTQLTNVTLVDSNGLVVAGPVDETVNGATIVLNSAITFPVGPMTYTIKGTVSSGASNGATYTLSTAPSSDWSSPVGQTSGTYTSFSGVGTITMSTMTVQSGQLNVSASASPAATNVTLNQNNYVLANIVLDASQSGEDVRLNSLPIVVNKISGVDATEQSNLTNCQLYNGSQVLNTQAIGSSQWSVDPANVAGLEANFIFQNPLTVPKGTTVTLSLECNIGGGFSINDAFNAGVSQYYKPTVTGVTSGNSINPNVTTSASGNMTVGTATMTASVPTALSYAQVAGGTTGVTIGTFTLQPTSGSVNLQNIGLQLNSNYASSSDLMNGVVRVMMGSTQVASVNFNGKTPVGHYYYATSTVSSASIAQNVQTTFTLQADLASIGNGQSGMSGHEIRVGLSDANGTSGNTQVDSGSTAQPNTGIAMFASTPTVALSTLPGTGVADGRLIAFAVTASNKNPIGIAKFNFTITPGASVTVTNPQLYAYTDAAFSSPAGGTTNGLVSPGIDSGPITSASATSTKMTSALEIPAGTTWYFLVKATSVTYSGSNATWNVTTALNGDGTDLAPSMNTVANLSSNNFVWSPNSLTTSALTAADWTSGFGVSGLPSFGTSQTRSN